VLHPTSRLTGEAPIVTAEGLYRVMRGWRDQAQEKVLMAQENGPG